MRAADTEQSAFCPEPLGAHERELPVRRRWRGLQPPSEVAQRNVRHGRDPCRALVEAGDGMEFCATSVQERGPALQGNLLERLQAIADEPWTGHVDSLDTILR